MDVEIKVDKNLKEKKVLILVPEVDKEALKLKEKIQNSSLNVLTGFYNGKLEFIDPDDIIRVYASDKKVYAVTMDKKYLLRLALYQVEDRLSSQKFIRISNSEIINLEKTKSFDLDYINTISCEMVNGDVCYVSRRTLKKVKEVLGI